MVGTYDGSGNLHNETVHWNGDQALFATRKVNGSAVLDDIKVDVQGDILPNDGGYNGLTFYDRAPGGVAMACHNAGGGNFAGFADSWGHNFHSGTAWSTPCLLNATTATATSIQWYGTYYTNAPGTPPIGQGGSLGMPRTDGLTSGYDTIQGVRAYDSNAGNWTAPDAYSGVVHSPNSQKSYIWNGNAPVTYTDPTGYATYLGNAWAKSVDLAVNEHAFIEVIEGGMDVAFEYGPTANNQIKQITSYGTNITSPSYNVMALVSVGGLSGTALDNKVLSVFSIISSYLDKADLSYNAFNSNDVMAAGLLMIGFTPKEVHQLVVGFGAQLGDSTTHGQELEQMIMNSIDSTTGYTYSFETNDSEAQSFNHQGETWTY